MKHKLIALAAAAAAIISCSKEEEVAVTCYVRGSKELSFEAKPETSQEVVLVTNSVWKMEIPDEASFLTVDPQSGDPKGTQQTFKIKVTAAENTGDDSREVTLKIKAGANAQRTVTLTVSQLGVATSKYHNCSEKTITDDMIFSSVCSRTTTAVQQSFDYDPVDNLVYFAQKNCLYRNVVSWATPAYTTSTTVPTHYMILKCFSHGNNIIVEHNADGKKYLWAPNLGTKEDDGYGDPNIISRLLLKDGASIDNLDSSLENFYFGLNPCWPAIDFDNDQIAICTYHQVYVYSLSELMAIPITSITLDKTITYGGTSTSGEKSWDSGITEFTGQPTFKGHDCRSVKPKYSFANDYASRSLHWQTFCIDDGKAYFLDQATPNDAGPITHDAYIEVYNFDGTMARTKVRQEYIQDSAGLLSRGFIDSSLCYNEPEGIKVDGEKMYVMYTVRGGSTIMTRRPVVFLLSSAVK